MPKVLPLLLLVALLAPAAVAGAHASMTSPPCQGLMAMVDPPSATLAKGGSQALSAAVYCGTQGGMQNVTADSTLDWSMSGSGGTLSPSTGPNTIFTATQNGSATVMVGAHYSGMSANGEASVTVGSSPGGKNSTQNCMMLMVSLTPSSVVVIPGSEQTFTGSVECGTMGGMQEVTADSNLTWSVTSSSGTLRGTFGPSTVFSALRAGNGTLWLVARYGGYHAETSAYLTVETASPGSTQSFVLSGQVTNLTGATVPGATVQVMTPSAKIVTAGGVTGVAGNFAFILPGEASYEIRAIYPTGQVVDSSPILLSGNQTLDVSLATHAPIGGTGTQSLPDWLVLVIVVIAFSSTFIAMFVGGEVAQLALLLPPLLLYSRIKRDQVLDHFQRGRIYGYIESHPGASYTDILRALSIANGVASYHLFTLEREQFVVSRREGNSRRYYANKAVSFDGETILSWIQDSILTLIRQRPGISQSEIARHLGTRRQNVNYNVSRLQRAGLLRLEGWGLTKKCFVNPPLGGSAEGAPR